MFIKQLTVFIENRAGRLEQVTQILKDNEINIVSVSLADTSDYGLLRLILSDPDKAVSVLTSGDENASIVLKTNDQERALDAIQNSSFELLTTEETYSMND